MKKLLLSVIIITMMVSCSTNETGAPAPVSVPAPIPIPVPAPVPAPVPVIVNQTWNYISLGKNSRIYLKNDGTIWGVWGNSCGQLGLGESVMRNGTIKTLTKIGIDSDWKYVQTDDSATFAIKNDGTLWTWGICNTIVYDTETKYINKYIPTKIGTDSNWKSLFYTNSTLLTIKTDGTLWEWLPNGKKVDRGDGYMVDVISPKKIEGISNCQSVTFTYTSTYVIKTDGSLWAWGKNNYGQLGDGTNIDKSLPTRIGTDNNWKTIVFTFATPLAIKTDGTLWAWGYNESGQLGDGTSINKNIPTRIGIDNNWKTIVSGDNYSIGIKTDGTLWSWGNNTYGDLGDGTRINRNIPTRIGTDLGWQSIWIGVRRTTVLKNDGSLWFWGEGNFFDNYDRPHLMATEDY
ncbi:RCC1 domain-containing protein [Flavobacterium sp.]|uniref:RCC1 domain-containing protein n=1 Tax=Flavobacterium sp. TaxID=239 RepID=UPI003752F7D8